MDVKAVGWECGLNSSGSRQGPVVSSCKRGKEPPGFTECSEFLEWLSNCSLLEKHSATNGYSKRVWIMVLWLRTGVRCLILRICFSHLLFTSFSFTGFRFNANEENTSRLNLRCFRSHFTAIMRSVSGNFLTYVVLLLNLTRLPSQ
jgi:hypothetical protein